MERAYALLRTKAFDEDSRSFTGWATVPKTDRIGDTINPMGVLFTNPLPLLHQHDHRKPIGLVRFRKPTEKGIEFDAEIARIDEPPALKERLDVAWAEIRHGLVRAVSIGFRSLKHERNEKGGIDFQAVEVLELSSVTIPALPEAVITAIKSMESISDELVQTIKSLDFRPGSVPLLKVTDSTLPKGAVRLLTP